MRGRGLIVWGIVLLTIGLLLFGAWALIERYASPATTVTIGGTAFKTTVVSTADTRAKGLGGTDKLADGSGMLFVFPTDGAQPIWMKDMSIDLDIIWLNDAKKVVNVERDVLASSYPKVYRSSVKARYVLEVPRGSAARAGITDGATATFDLPANLKIE